jgi:hypothetical protein
MYGFCVLKYLKKSFDRTWHIGLLYKLSTLKFSTRLIRLIRSFLSQGNFRVSVEGLPPHSTVYIYINDTPQTPGVYPDFFVDDTCIYATDCKEGFIPIKLQRGLSTIDTWCEHWIIKIYQDKTHRIYFSHRLRPPEAHLTLNGQNIRFVSLAIYLSVIFNNIITWRLHIEMIKAKAYRTPCSKVSF